MIHLRYFQAKAYNILEPVPFSYKLSRIVEVFSRNDSHELQSRSGQTGVRETCRNLSEVLPNPCENGVRSPRLSKGKGVHVMVSTATNSSLLCGRTRAELDHGNIFLFSLTSAANSRAAFHCHTTMSVFPLTTRPV